MRLFSVVLCFFLLLIWVTPKGFKTKLRCPEDLTYWTVPAVRFWTHPPAFSNSLVKVSPAETLEPTHPVGCGTALQWETLHTLAFINPVSPRA